MIHFTSLLGTFARCASSWRRRPRLCILPVPRPILLHGIELYDLGASIGLRRTVIVAFPVCTLGKQPPAKRCGTTDACQLLILFLQSLLRCTDAQKAFENELYYVAFPQVEEQAAAARCRSRGGSRARLPKLSSLSGAGKIQHTLFQQLDIYNTPDPNVNALRMGNNLQIRLYWNRFAPHHLGWYENTLQIVRHGPAYPSLIRELPAHTVFSRYV